MVTIGLIPELSAEAARRAALGAGAKVIKVYSFRLSNKELKELETLSPDILLLAGGTDGGNREVILDNARMLSQSQVQCPILIAGNKAAADEVDSILSSSGKNTLITDNVMPEVNVLNVEPAREMIRKVFIDRIIEAKGLKKAEDFVEGILMPTPTAVLQGRSITVPGDGFGKGVGGFGDRRRRGGHDGRPLHRDGESDSGRSGAQRASRASGQAHGGRGLGDPV